MRRAREIGLVMTIASALGALTVAAATAVTPEVLHEGKEVSKKTVKVSGKTTKLYVEVSGNHYLVTCQTATSTGGKIKGTTEVENVTAKFKSCKAKENEETKECSVRSSSPSGAEGELISKTLKGKLGEVALSEATSGVGLKLEPVSGTTYITLMGSLECLPAENSEAKGSLIGEVTPINTSVLTAHSNYKVQEGTPELQVISKFKGESGVQQLEAFSVQIGVEGEEKVEFEEKVEIT